MTRTSTELLPLQPTGRTSPVASTRSSSSWVSAGSAPISSSSSVPPSASTMPADALGECAGEGAGDMAEQFAVDDVGRHRLAIDLDHRRLGAQAGGVDRAGEGFLAAARLADDQDRQAVARALGGDRQRDAEIGRGADQLLERSASGASFSDNGASSPVGAAAVGIGGERLEQPLGRDRLDQEIGGAGAHRVDRERDRAAVGQHDDRQRRPVSAQGARSWPGRSLASQLPSSAAWTSRPCGPCSRPTALSPHGGADHAPSGARGDRRHAPPFGGVGIDQQ